LIGELLHGTPNQGFNGWAPAHAPHRCTM